MKNKIAACSALFLGLAILAPAAQAAGSVDFNAQLQAMAKEGWQVKDIKPIVISPANSKENSVKVAMAEQLTLADMAAITFRDGRDSKIPSNIAAAVGLVEAQEEFPVKALGDKVGEARKGFNVSNARGKTDIILSIRVDSKVKLYLTSPTGKLEKAVGASFGSQEADLIPVKDAEADFQKELAFWQKGFQDYLKEKESTKASSEKP